ncbi:DUF2793 domain-containing protein [Methylobacterium sp. J-030]|uniref:DUF2793 domain-containing protein n=1 Tax=Methylobacterium sp. J-030 TaxID=2836627 RepID=UPI001FBA2DCF|nr:DUF2793 domain-containing protein [Methylobacterium sp. J-030]MCJ2071200.1 DUF2793 domain-containing protein [Methylobacterium sp. J-030]
MSDVTPHLGLPLVAASQAQKHVTHNEALGLLDALVQLACLDKDLTAPPSSPTEGDRYLVVTSNPGGAWAGLAGQVVRYADGVWTGAVPRAGWFAYVMDEADLYVFDGAAWTSFRRTLATIQSVTRLGINTEADATNRLAVKADAALLTWDDATPGSGDMRITVNKKAAVRDAAFVFQTGYATRALFGTLGGDDVVLKTSPDGAAFTTALTAAAATGIVAFAASPTAPTPAATDNSARLATTAYADRGDAAAVARTPVKDAAYTILPADRTVAVVALTAARTLTLPPAAAYPPGVTLVVVDESGACSAANTLTLARASASDAVNGLPAVSLAAPFAYAALQSNGATRWTLVDLSTASLAQQASDAVAITGGSITGTRIGPATLSRWSYANTPGALGAGGFVNLWAYGTTDGGAKGASQLKLGAPGSAPNQRASVAFYATFDNFPADAGPRRTADFIAGFASDGKYGGNTNGTWGSEYLALNVGMAGWNNDDESLGTEVLRLTGGNTGHGGVGPMVLPGTDNAIGLGVADRRWSTVYAATGAINTSDAGEKVVLGEPDPRVFDAILAVPLVAYRWAEAVARKGPDGARLHYGATAQAVRDAFLAHGLDPCRYGLFCADDLTPRTVDPLLIGPEREAAEREAAARPARWRYGLRYDQFDRLRTEAVRRLWAGKAP